MISLLSGLQTYLPEDLQIPLARLQGFLRRGKSSSTSPSQSLSLPSQISVPGVLAITLHSIFRPSELQINLPVFWHTPLPTVQGFLRLTNPLSITPSQSLSLPSHISLVGVTSPTHGPKPEPSSLHTCLPDLQIPIPFVWGKSL